MNKLVIIIYKFEFRCHQEMFINKLEACLANDFKL